LIQNISRESRQAGCRAQVEVEGSESNWNGNKENIQERVNLRVCVISNKVKIGLHKVETTVHGNLVHYLYADCMCKGFPLHSPQSVSSFKFHTTWVPNGKHVNTMFQGFTIDLFNKFKSTLFPLLPTLNISNRKKSIVILYNTQSLLQSIIKLTSWSYAFYNRKSKEILYHQSWQLGYINKTICECIL